MRAHDLENQSVNWGPRLLMFFVFLFFLIVFFFLSLLKLEDILWIEDIVITITFFINSRVDMASFLDPHKLIARNAFSTFLGAWNETESKGGIESEALKCQFSQVKGDLNLQEMLKSVLILKNNTKEKSSCDTHPFSSIVSSKS
jgi:hypothetical protein